MTAYNIDTLKKLVRPEQIFENEPMRDHITFRVGGPADLLIQPEVAQVAEVIACCRKEGIPYTVIGNGSNLLVSDKGIRGVVIELSRPASNISIDGCRIYAEAGAMLAKTASLAAGEGLTGMEFTSGIPGSVGGAVVMNAGAYGGEMAQIIESVDILDEEGNRRTLSAEEMDFSYRHSCIMEHPYIVLSAVMQLEKGDAEQIRLRMQELAVQRKEKQPLEYPSAGSTFKRPEGYFAGKLIMDAGLRGYSVGGAQVSEKHCGFVVNKGGATQADISALMQHVQDEVKKQFGVTLEPEVRKLGDFE
ncbi:MAG: UDP-N-acetylmuramate dehydrogenase [Lachnospiraceae bacterium]|nr:UDP-N-acetylmuramate dehydrogenase [Lachnospiraceae bacterium]